MSTRALKPTFAALALAAALAGAALAQGGGTSPGKIGELSDLAAWVNRMPVAVPALYVVGKITAPTPCHEAIAEYAGESKSNPPVYLVRVTLHARPGMCIQVISTVPFRYVQPNYAGMHQRVEVASEQDRKEIAITVAH